MKINSPPASVLVPARPDEVSSKSEKMANVNGNGVASQMVANGTFSSNGVAAINGGEKSSRTSVANGSHHHESSSSQITQRITRQRVVAVTTECHRRLLSLTNGEFSKPESEESFLNYVANERLHRMPHRGSRWDKILRWAEYFATQVSALHESVSPFVPNSAETAQVVWAGCRILLQVSSSWSFPFGEGCLTIIRWALNTRKRWIRYSAYFTK